MGALVEVDAAVLGHRFRLREAAVRARDDGTDGDRAAHPTAEPHALANRRFRPVDKPQPPAIPLSTYHLDADPLPIPATG